MAEEEKKFEVRDKRVFNQEGEQVREPSKEAPAPDFSPAGGEGKHTEEHGGPHTHPKGGIRIRRASFLRWISSPSSAPWGLRP